jgi:predicted dehydrogenase
MADLRVGLIGIGGMGGCHYGNYKDVKGAKLVAVADVRVDMAKEKTAGTDITVYADYKEMIEKENLDMVDICTPSYMHKDMAIYCLSKNLHVLCEKPMTLNKKDAAAVVKAANATDKFFMAAHVVRFMGPYAYLKGVIESGEMGKLIRLDMKRISSIPTWSWEDWMRDEKRSGGVATDLSIHDIDFVQSVLGMPDKITSYKTGIKNNSDYIVSSLTYGDTLVTCEGTWYNCQIPFKASFLAVFQNGFVELSDKLYKNGAEVVIEQKSADSLDLEINVGNDNGYLAEIQYFVDCVNNDREITYVTPESSARSVELVDIIKKKAVKL